MVQLLVGDPFILEADRCLSRVRAPTHTESLRDESVVFRCYRRRTPSSVNIPCDCRPISRPTCLEAQEKANAEPTQSQQLEGSASAICFARCWPEVLDQGLRSYQGPPAADYQLSIVAVGLRSALVGRRKEAEQAVRLIAYAGGEVQPIARSGGMVVAKA
jgi:hypothetical protein